MKKSLFNMCLIVALVAGLLTAYGCGGAGNVPQNQLEGIDSLDESEKELLNYFQEVYQPLETTILAFEIDYKNSEFLDLGEYRAVRRELDIRSSNDYTWIGDLEGVKGDVILVVQDNIVTGTLKVFEVDGVKLYTIRSLGPGKHLVMMEEDQSLLPPEHPPEFKDIENCDNAGGQWVEFSNSCADVCGVTENSVCTHASTMSCECGEGACWAGSGCLVEDVQIDY
jgi:hypothetical protein